MVARGCGQRGMGSYCLLDLEVQFYKMKWVLEMDGGDGCMTLQMYWILLNCMLKNGSGGKFYIMCILPP